LERVRAAFQRQLATLQEELQAHEEELKRAIEQDRLRQAAVEHEREEIMVLRKADR
jgi:hypothetical protein